MLSKISMDVDYGKDTLWIAWMRANILKGRSFWILRATSSSSWWWKKLLKLRSIFRTVISFEDGNDIFFWFDNWNPIGPLLDFYGVGVFQFLGLPLTSKLSTVLHNQL